MGEKSRGNYTTGGWCPVRGKCANDGKCDGCLRRGLFRAKKAVDRDKGSV